MIPYAEYVKRNSGYVTAEVQERIRSTRLLLAGCGIGSTVAEAFVRLGFLHVTLVDADTVAPHNLNRQNFVSSDVGRPKAVALGERLRAVNPEAAIRVEETMLGPDNADALVGEADLVFDTIDFLDIVGIVALHDATRRRGIPIISALSAGWGAAAIYFSAACSVSFREIFGLPAKGDISSASYVSLFSDVVERIGRHLEPDVAASLAKTLCVMSDGTPCPASQVSAGAASVAALATAMAARILAGKPVTEAPRMAMLNMGTVLSQGGIELM